MAQHDGRAALPAGCTDTPELRGGGVPGGQKAGPIRRGRVRGPGNPPRGVGLKSGGGAFAKGRSPAGMGAAGAGGRFYHGRVTPPATARDQWGRVPGAQWLPLGLPGALPEGRLDTAG